MNATQADNLRILIRHMETRVTRTLNMSSYETCGTPACALGEATLCSALARQLPAIRDLNRKVHGDLFVETMADNDRLFGYEGLRTYVWETDSVTPQEWAAEARKVLAENGYSMDAPDDGFAAFMDKVREPVAVESMS